MNRDYAAHFFRWGFATNFVRAGMNVLDVGCGVEQQLVKVLLKSLTYVPKLYVGVDLNKIGKPTKIAWTRTHDEFDFTSRWKELADEYGLFDVIVNYEMIEHMEVKDARKLLRGMRALLRPGTGRLLLSTPVYNNIHMAANHIHEYGFDELRQELTNADFEVERVHGTFMTANAMKKVMNPTEKALVEELHKFHPWEVLANFLAPKYPQAASNCCWVLRRA